MVIFGDRSMLPPTPLVNPHAHIEHLFLEELIEQLEKDHPDSPLIGVFAPLLVPDIQLANQAKAYYHFITGNPNLSIKEREVLSNVFVHFFSQRFKDLTIKEIYQMIAELTPIEETQVGRELIDKGVEKAAIAIKMINAGKTDLEIVEASGLPINTIEDLRKKVMG